MSKWRQTRPVFGAAAGAAGHSCFATAATTGSLPGRHPVVEPARVVCVHRMTNPIEANLIKGLLEQQGIQVEISGEGLVGAYAGVPRVCDVRLLVPPGQRQQALSVIEGYEAAKGEPDDGRHWVCAGCGEQNASNFEICWNCGVPGEAA